VFRLSPQTIDALALIISGGSANDTSPPIGIYRSGPKIESFMRACGVDMSVGSNSRLPALSKALLDLHRREELQTLQTIIEHAADPRDFAREPERLSQVIDHLNTYLRLDGVELQHQGGRVRLVTAGTSAPIVSGLVAVARTLDLDTVQRELERALANAESDPEDAVTAACSIVESVCRSVLIELGLPLPDKKDIQGLYRAVRAPLGLSPDREDLPPEAAEDIKTILGGLSTVVQGIGALRTHVGDAHGREKGFRRIDARIARLAIHAAGNIGLFVIDTWQQKFPTKALHAH
jgi:hypothetical protein